MAAPPAGARRAVVKIWDLPVRLFHWSVVILVGAAWWTAQHDEMSLHRICGYLVGGLVLFRIAWGLVGSSTARFSSFLRGPRTLLSYARTLFGPKTSDFVPGHNPMGGWSVVALLAVLLTDVGVGLFCVDVDGEESGPLADRISFDAGRLAAHWHQLLFNGLLALICLHLLAVGFYLVVKRDNLLLPMVTGGRRIEGSARGMEPAPVWRFLASAAAATLVILALARGLK